MRPRRNFNDPLLTSRRRVPLKEMRQNKEKRRRSASTESELFRTLYRDNFEGLNVEIPTPRRRIGPKIVQPQVSKSTKVLETLSSDLLYRYDDKTYDGQTHSEFLKRLKSGPVPAYSLFVDSNYSPTWRRCFVDGFEDELYSIVFIPEGIRKQVRRISLRFDFEDPARFEARRKAAEQARLLADETLKEDIEAASRIDPSLENPLLDKILKLFPKTPLVAQLAEEVHQAFLFTLERGFPQRPTQSENPGRLAIPPIVLPEPVALRAIMSELEAFSTKDFLQEVLDTLPKEVALGELTTAVTFAAETASSFARGELSRTLYSLAHDLSDQPSQRFITMVDLRFASALVAQANLLITTLKNFQMSNSITYTPVADMNLSTIDPTENAITAEISSMIRSLRHVFSNGSVIKLNSLAESDSPVTLFEGNLIEIEEAAIKEMTDLLQNDTKSLKEFFSMLRMVASGSPTNVEDFIVSILPSDVLDTLLGGLDPTSEPSEVDIVKVSDAITKAIRSDRELEKYDVFKGKLMKVDVSLFIRDARERASRFVESTVQYLDKLCEAKLNESDTLSKGLSDKAAAPPASVDEWAEQRALLSRLAVFSRGSDETLKKVADIVGMLENVRAPTTLSTSRVYASRIYLRRLIDESKILNELSESRRNPLSDVYEKSHSKLQEDSKALFEEIEKTVMYGSKSTDSHEVCPAVGDDLDDFLVTEEVFSEEEKLKQLENLEESLRSDAHNLSIEFQPCEALSNARTLISYAITIISAYNFLNSDIETLLSSDIRTLDATAAGDSLADCESNLERIREKLPNRLMPLLDSLLSRTRTLATSLPLVRALCSPSLRSRHWRTISALAGETLTAGDALTWHWLSASPLASKLPEITAIARMARGEASVESSINDINFALLQAKPRVTSDPRAALAVLSRHRSLVRSLLSSPFIKPHVTKLRESRELAEALRVEIRKAAETHGQFSEIKPAVDVALGQGLASRVAALEAGLSEMTFRQLATDANAARELDEAMKGIKLDLDKVLKEKRAAFKRFSLLSDAQLMAVIASGGPGYETLMFPGVMKYSIDDGRFCRGFKGFDGELTFSAMVPVTRSSVERWLKKAEEQMFLTLKDDTQVNIGRVTLDRGLEYYGNGRSIISDEGLAASIEAGIPSIVVGEESAKVVSDTIKSLRRFAVTLKCVSGITWEGLSKGIDKICASGADIIIENIGYLSKSVCDSLCALVAGGLPTLVIASNENYSFPECVLIAFKPIKLSSPVTIQSDISTPNLLSPHSSSESMPSTPILKPKADGLLGNIINTIIDKTPLVVYGPPGAGKTSLLRQAADKLNLPILHVSLSLPLPSSLQTVVTPHLIVFDGEVTESVTPLSSRQILLPDGSLTLLSENTSVVFETTSVSDLQGVAMIEVPEKHFSLKDRIALYVAKNKNDYPADRMQELSHFAERVMSLSEKPHLDIHSFLSMSEIFITQEGYLKNFLLSAFWSIGSQMSSTSLLKLDASLRKMFPDISPPGFIGDYIVEDGNWCKCKLPHISIIKTLLVAGKSVIMKGQGDLYDEALAASDQFDAQIFAAPPGTDLAGLVEASLPDSREEFIGDRMLLALLKLDLSPGSPSASFVKHSLDAGNSLLLIGTDGPIDPRLSNRFFTVCFPSAASPVAPPRKPILSKRLVVELDDQGISKTLCVKSNNSISVRIKRDSQRDISTLQSLLAIEKARVVVECQTADRAISVIQVIADSLSLPIRSSLVETLQPMEFMRDCLLASGKTKTDMIAVVSVDSLSDTDAEMLYCLSRGILIHGTLSRHDVFFAASDSETLPAPFLAAAASKLRVVFLSSKPTLHSLPSVHILPSDADVVSLALDKVTGLINDFESGNITEPEVVPEEPSEQPVINEADVLREELKHAVDKAKEVMTAAESELRNLTARDVAVVKAMVSPPNGVVLAVKAARVLLGEELPPEEDNKWRNVRSILNETSFIQRLVSRASSLEGQALERLRTYLMDPAFDPSVIERASAAAASICRFVRAVPPYRDALNEVKRREQELADREAQDVPSEESPEEEVRSVISENEPEPEVQDISIIEALEKCKELLNEKTSETEKWAIIDSISTFPAHFLKILAAGKPLSYILASSTLETDIQSAHQNGKVSIVYGAHGVPLRNLTNPTAFFDDSTSESLTPEMVATIIASEVVGPKLPLIDYAEAVESLHESILSLADSILANPFSTKSKRLLRETETKNEVRKRLENEVKGKSEELNQVKAQIMPLVQGLHENGDLGLGFPLLSRAASSPNLRNKFLQLYADALTLEESRSKLSVVGATIVETISLMRRFQGEDQLLKQFTVFVSRTREASELINFLKIDRNAAVCTHINAEHVLDKKSREGGIVAIVVSDIEAASSAIGSMLRILSSGWQNPNFGTVLIVSDVSPERVRALPGISLLNIFISKGPSIVKEATSFTKRVLKGMKPRQGFFLSRFDSAMNASVESGFSFNAVRVASKFVDRIPIPDLNSIRDFIIDVVYLGEGKGNRETAMKIWRLASENPEEFESESFDIMKILSL